MRKLRHGKDGELPEVLQIERWSDTTRREALPWGGTLECWKSKNHIKALAPCWEEVGEVRSHQALQATGLPVVQGSVFSIPCICWRLSVEFGKTAWLSQRKWLVFNPALVRGDRSAAWPWEGTRPTWDPIPAWLFTHRMTLDEPQKLDGSQSLFL